MRVRTLESFWLVKNGLLFSYPSLQKSIKAQIVVIGSGITGALITHALLENGYEVVLIDKGDVAFGSTAATTAMLQYEIDVPLFKLAKTIGEENAVLCYKEGIRSIHKLNKLINDNKIECGFKLKQSLYFSHNANAAELLYKEFKIREKHNLGVEWLPENAVLNRYGINSYGAILSGTAASMDAFQFTHKLIKKNCSRGLQVYDQTIIKEVEYNQNNIEITTTDGHVIVCNKIVYCSGYETVKSLNGNIAKLISTFACVSEQNITLSDNFENILAWNTEKPYMYMRTTADNRLLVGGADVNFNSGAMRQKMKDVKSNELILNLKKIIPHINFITDFTWAGVFGTTADGLPYIGAHPEFKNTYYVLGFGGNGITFSVQGMGLLIDVIQNKSNPLLHLYRFNR